MLKNMKQTYLSLSLASLLFSRKFIYFSASLVYLFIYYILLAISFSLLGSIAYVLCVYSLALTGSIWLYGLYALMDASSHWHSSVHPACHYNSKCICQRTPVIHACPHTLLCSFTHSLLPARTITG